MSSMIERQLVELEKRYWQALKNKDVEAAIELTDDPCIVAGAQGVGSIDHATYAAMMKGPAWTIVDFELRDVQARLLSDDTAVVAYTVHEELTVDGAGQHRRGRHIDVGAPRRALASCATHRVACGRSLRQGSPAAGER